MGGAGDDRNETTGRTSSWLDGLGLGFVGRAESPPRWRVDPGASPSPSRSRRRHRGGSRGGGASRPSPAAIADDIRNDPAFLDDDDDDDDDECGRGRGPEPPLPPVPSMPRRDAPSGGGGGAPIATAAALVPRSRFPPATTTATTAAAAAALPRRSSQKKMKDLQREVDLALEYFSRETEHELDDADGDEYLDRHGKCRRMDELGRMSPFESDAGSSATPTVAATSLASSTDCCADEFRDLHTKLVCTAESSAASANPPQSSGGLAPKHKTKSILSLPLSLLPSSTQLNCSYDYEEEKKFDIAMAEQLGQCCVLDGRDRNSHVDFNSNSSMREALEPFIAVARLRREEAREQVFNTLDLLMMPQEPHECAARRASTTSELGIHIGSTYGVPYPALRNESSFLYDVETFPLGEILAETLAVEDLAKIHLDYPLIKDKRRLMAPLRNRGKRRRFHHSFDSFVTSHVIPLLHSQALSKGIFYTNRHQLQKGQPQRIVYRYQAFPSINVVRPGECSTDPHCDMAQGHSIGNISYHIPLTATFGTNAIYAESRPGREDWHPLAARSPGLGFQFDGARCIHFNLRNETDATRVSLNFRIGIARAPDFGGVAYDPGDQLCCPELLRDDFSVENPGFYDEVIVNVGDVPRSFLPGPVAVKRRGSVSVVG